MACAMPVAAQAERGDEAFERGYAAFDLRQYARAAEHWRTAADLGHARAQNGLGVLYRDGLGVTRDPAEAARWFHASAARGYAFGMYNLGLLYRDGTGVMRSDVEAYKWFYLASTVNFDPVAAREADRIAARMTEAQVAEARYRAQIWFDRFFFGRSMNQ